ncbi:MAG: Gfo/Idh/MocA family oxidoreductase [Solobacterium sp.]|nr:Gfo/Idh/MocA family oxidoreductase [Solobacterium sp.]
MKQPVRFAMIGSGWRSLYYIRIAKALPQYFEVCMMLCRTQEKAQYMSETYHIPACVSEEEVDSAEPDVIVIAAKKEVNAVLSMHWLEKGYTVLQETPAGIDRETLEQLMKTGGKLVIAEQYRRYPEYTAVKKLLETDLIGKPDHLYLSLAHEYHAASLIRYFLDILAGTPFDVVTKQWSFLTAETLTRYERITDRRVSPKQRTSALFTYEGNKGAVYDFDSEQYRSPIRSSHFRIQGTCGEISDQTVRYLDDNNQAQTDLIHVMYRTIETDDPNPNLHTVREITQISFRDQILYQPVFGLCSLAQDETAIASILYDTAMYASGEGESPYPLAEAIDDALTAIRMKEFICG